MSSFATESSLSVLQILHQPYANELTEESARVSESNPHLKVHLRPHQAACVNAMLEQEKRLTTGWDISGERLWSSWSVLGDGVGVGKSLTVLAHIAELKRKESVANIAPVVSKRSSSYLFSIMSTTDLSNCPASLIVVPHTLFRQWSTYIKDQTTLKTLFATTKKVVDDGDFLKQVFQSDIVLVSNTLYKHMMSKCSDIQFKRVYIDETDTIYIAGTGLLPRAKFFWFITASWANLLYPGQLVWIPHRYLQTLVFSATSQFKPDFREQFRAAYQGASQQPYMERHWLTSTSFLRPILFPNHPLRGHLVLRSSQDFIRLSIQLPQMFRHTILCRASIAYQVVANVITSEVRNYLHAGDIQSALQHLGVTEENQANLIQAVTENRTKELERLRKTYEFKSSIEYATPQAKEQALANLKQKIEHLEAQIQSIRERIENFQREVCPICFDEPTDPLLTNCCERIFCASCILTSLTRNLACPMCRKLTNPKQLKKITNADAPSAKVPETPLQQPPLKREALLRLLRENPEGRFLVFSRYDNPLAQIANECEANKITVRELKGNKDVIQASLTQFEKGKIRCLLLNSLHAGAGLTITSATHVILLHAMNMEEEKQIIGRAYRLGRKQPLHIYKLLHADEMEDAEN